MQTTCSRQSGPSISPASWRRTATVYPKYGLRTVARSLAVSLVLALGSVPTTTRAAVDITGTWSLCLELTLGLYCDNLVGATLIAANNQFTIDMSDPRLEPPFNECIVTGTIDPESGTLQGSGCDLGGLVMPAVVSGLATETSLQGTWSQLCYWDFSGVRACPACDDGDDCTADGCGTTACSEGGSSCTYVGLGSTTPMPCDDGDPCTIGDVCGRPGLDYGGCQSGSPRDCYDGEVCTSDSCDPVTGECLHEHNTNPCDDGNACTTNDTCSDGACVSGEELTCNAACEACDPLIGCVVMPRDDCREPIVPQKASLLLKDNPSDAGDKVIWKWIKGEETGTADFGDPVNTDDYTLCIYEEAGGSPNLFLNPTAPANSICPFGASGKPCWEALGSKGYRYKDRGLLTPDGLSRVRLKPGGDGKAKVIVKGKGENLALPSPMDVSLPVTVQLQAGNGECWQAKYFTAFRNREDLFKARAGSPSGAFLGLTSGTLD